MSHALSFPQSFFKNEQARQEPPPESFSQNSKREV
jgi:hypothetical protein